MTGQRSFLRFAIETVHRTLSSRTDFMTGGAVVSPLRYRNYSLDGSFTFAFVAQSLRDKIVPIL